VNKMQIAVAGILCLTVISDGSPSMCLSLQVMAQSKVPSICKIDELKLKDWQARWEKEIIANLRNRYCETEMGEELGWVMSPIIGGFYYGYMATRDPKWVDLLVNCADSWIKRAKREPDGYLGWPKSGAAGTNVDFLDRFNADSLVGEAMALRYVVLMADEIRKTPSLTERYANRAESFIRLSEQIFEKWEKRGAWRDTERGDGITVVLAFGIDPKDGGWTDGYERRNDYGNGFSHPNNKANLVSCWLLAMFDATQKLRYKERAEKWFRLMKSRMKLDGYGNFRIWNYWEPAGAWDYTVFSLPKHWIGRHPNVGYYDIDVEGIVTAYEHSVVFNMEDIGRLINTALAENQDWTALVPYNNTIRRKFEEFHKPDSWRGMIVTPWYMANYARMQDASPSPR
jgi:hypothetical protein